MPYTPPLFSSWKRNPARHFASVLLIRGRRPPAIQYAAHTDSLVHTHREREREKERKENKNFHSPADLSFGN